MTDPNTTHPPARPGSSAGGRSHRAARGARAIASFPHSRPSPRRSPTHELPIPSSARRGLLKLAAAGALMLAGTVQAQAPEKVKVAAIYTVPVEQQWVSRIHKALTAARDRGEIDYAFSENVTNADYERVMRQYAEQGNKLVVGEAFAVEAAARKVAKDYPQTAFLMGSSSKPQQPNFAVFDNYIQEPAYLTGMIAAGMSQTGKIGLVGGYPIPEVNRLMQAFIEARARSTPRPSSPSPSSAPGSIPEGQGSRLRHDRQGHRRALRRALRRVGRRQGTRQAGHRQRDRHPAAVPETVVASALWSMEPTIDAALKQVKAGAFKADDYGQYSLMKHKRSSLAPLGTFAGKIPADLIAKVEAKQKAILDGSFSVKVNDKEPKSSAR